MATNDEGFDIGQAARDKGVERDEPVVLPPNEPSRQVERALEQAIKAVIIVAAARTAQNIAKSAKLDKITLWRTEQAWRQQGFTQDAISALRRIFNELLMAAARMVDKGLRLEELRHRNDFVVAVRKEIGIDLAPIVRSPTVEPHIQAAVRQNVALIKGLSDQVAGRLETTLMTLIVQGATNKVIEEAIRDGFGFGKKRARTIARDQAAKFNGTLNRIRQEEVGIKEYQWSTSRDERVRKSHKVREGKTYRWNSPPFDGHPGQPINCRCTARAVIEF